MYNEERKKRYIKLKEDSVTLPYRSLELLFEKTEPFEERAGKDVCEWTPQEIMEYYKYRDSYSLSSLVVCNSNLTQYTNWCLTETLVPDGQNHFQEIRPDMLDGCVNKESLSQMIISREELVKRIDELPNYTDRFMMLAFFEGICGIRYSEMAEAKIDAIHGNRISLCSGRELLISDKLKEIAEYAAAEETFQTYGPTGKCIKYSDLNPSGAIFKFAKKNNANAGVTAMTQIVGRRFVKAVDYTGLPKQMTVKNLMVSGKLNFIKGIMAREGKAIEDVIVDNRDEINAQYNVDTIKSSAVFLRKYKQYFD